MTNALLDDMIARWQNAAGSELSNYQLFVADLCRVLGVDSPLPATGDPTTDAYVFERGVTFAHGDGSSSAGRIDCYKRGAFVFEAKKIRSEERTKAFDEALLRARSQAEAYARALPASEGRPPLVIVADVGRVIELYSEFTRTGATYTPFPDPTSHRIRLADLRRPEVRERLKAAWVDPLSLDPSRTTARVTRVIAGQLAEVARSLEEAGFAPEDVAAFLSRCLFTMFAEDIGLLPERCFAQLLETYRSDPDVLARMFVELWKAMDRGEFSVVLAKTLPRFNGKLFKDPRALPLTSDQIELLLTAARADWKQVEPAIFGTLLERALVPGERHSLGAHYTPRAYVERLVLPTIVEPLREDWSHTQAAALVLATEGKLEDAWRVLRGFIQTLANVRVLDPACGSGNFLYVTLEHLKRLEGEVLNQLESLGDTQSRMEMAGVTVDPHQLLGLELNPRAAEIAEMVLWIGYLQWHYRTRGDVSPSDPVLKDFKNIECRDAVISFDRVEYSRDEQGRVVARWDGQSRKKHAVTGLDVPDDGARAPVETYINPRPAIWPEADFIVGNPPFIGSKRMRDVLGDGYVDAVQAAWPAIPEATDFVMRWWHHAAELVRAGKVRRFGLITTNSMRQVYVRRAVEPHLCGEPPLALVFAVPDHPWVDASDGAAVRIAMTVGEQGQAEGRLVTVQRERDKATETGDDLVERTEMATGRIHADLTVGVDVTRAVPLKSNLELCSVGMKTIGAAFQVDLALAASLGLGTAQGLESHIRPYLNGRDWVSTSRQLYVIDFFGLEEAELRRRFPDAYQYLLTHAKPERDQNRNALFRRVWWVIGHPRPQFRLATAGLPRYIVTVETQKHRFFGFLDRSVVPDSTLVTFAFDSAYYLGVLSSRVHVVWTLAAGGTLEDRPRYNKTKCFEAFPFPIGTEEQRTRIAAIAEDIDAHRKRQQASHAGLTLTALYNVVERIRAGETLSARDREIHDRGLATLLLGLHDQLDLAVLEAYGWEDLAENIVGKPGATAPSPVKSERQLAAEEELRRRLMLLNTTRALEEASGAVLWLRPQLQARGVEGGGIQTIIDAGVEPFDDDGRVAVKIPWPKEPSAQARALADLLATSRWPLTLEDIASRFGARGRWRERLGPLLDMLIVLGKARTIPNGRNAKLARYARAE
ncbi:MAG: class I SAM-dependent DNA methyltransferase [Candidatus Eisenbacteria bacterium]|nr:class I SAM-dependent DNA methyltransferase [Candidatus Eisenbacteria bacterium]